MAATEQSPLWVISVLCPALTHQPGLKNLFPLPQRLTLLLLFSDCALETLDLNGLGIQPGVLAHCRVQLIFLARFFLHTFRICPRAKEQHLEGAGLGIAALPALRGGR